MISSKRFALSTHEGSGNLTAIPHMILFVTLAGLKLQ